MTTSRWTTGVLAAGLLAFPMSAMALQDEPAKPAAPAAPAAPDAPKADAKPAQALKIVVTSVQGSVQVRMAEDKDWQKAAVGMELVIGAEIRTGIRSAIQFVIDGNHTVAVDRLGSVKVLDAIRADGKVKTDVGMKYGRTQYKVEANADEHEARIHAPTATLAVRGSVVQLTDDDAFGSYAIVDDSKTASYSLRGTATLSLASIDLQRGPVAGPKAGGDTADAPAEVLHRDSNLDSGASGGRTDDERGLIGDYQARNGHDLGRNIPTTEYRLWSNQRNFRIGIATSAFVPGSLVLELNWVGNADLDLIARDGAGGLISTVPGILPGAQTMLRQGLPGAAAAGPDHNGPNGTERIVWTNPPVGAYTSGVKFFGGTTPADFNVTGTLFPNQSQTNGKIVFMQSGTLGPGDPDAVGNFPLQGSQR